MDSKKRHLILFTVCTSTFMATLDSSIVNISLPVIAKELGVSISAIQWVVTSYLITISAFLFIWGKLSDIYSRKNLFMGGFSIFILGSLFCSLSQTLPMLVFSRVVQGIGASVTMALVQGIVTLIFPPNERGKALGMIATVVALGSLVGPSLGGVLVYFWGWPSVFTINLPVGMFGILMAWHFLPSKIEGDASPIEKKPFDILGAFLLSTLVIGFFLTLLSYQDGVISLSTLLLSFLVFIPLFALFVHQEKRAVDPMLNLAIFQNWEFSSGVLSLWIFFVSMFAYTFFMPFYLQQICDYDVLKSGLLMSIYPLVTGVCSPIFGRLSDKISYRPLTVSGMTLNGLAMLILTTVNRQTPEAFTALIICLLGLGASIFQSPNTSSIMGAVDRKLVGIAGSINAFFRNFGMVTGTTFSVLLFSAMTQLDVSALSSAHLPEVQFLKGFHTVMFAASLLSFAVALLGMLRGKVTSTEVK